jgi:hypothetical protein
MKKVFLIILTLSALSILVYANEKYSMYFTDARYNSNQKKFYFLKWDLIEDNDYNSLQRYVRGDFEGKKLKKITKYYKGQVQAELILNDDAVCIVKRDFNRGILLYEMHYNSEGFVPYADIKTNLVKRISYRQGSIASISYFDGRGRQLRTERSR